VLNRSLVEQLGADNDRGLSIVPKLRIRSSRVATVPAQVGKAALKAAVADGRRALLSALKRYRKEPWSGSK
jgi:hypothetical protein